MMTAPAATPPAVPGPPRPARPLPTSPDLPYRFWATSEPYVGPPLPDHLELPCDDGKPVNNALEPPQGDLLTDTLEPHLRELFPDEQYFIGRDVGIYFKRDANNPIDGARAPDWYLVAGVPPLYQGRFRRSYVLWKEHVPPLIAMEYISGDGSEERDATPGSGKYWVYENIIRPHYYVLFEQEENRFEVLALEQGKYVILPANASGRVAIPHLKVELGTWTGRYNNLEGTWLRWWKPDGTMLPNRYEREATAQQAKVEAERGKVEAERGKVEAEREVARLRELLMAQGIDPANGPASRGHGSDEAAKKDQ